MGLIERARRGYRPTTLELELAAELERIRKAASEISKRNFGHPAEKLAEITKIFEGLK